MMTQNATLNRPSGDVTTTALQWYLDHGVDICLQDTATSYNTPKKPAILQDAVTAQAALNPSITPPKTPLAKTSTTAPVTPSIGAAQAIIEAEKLASECQTLDELKNAIKNFDGLAVRKTAANIVFGDGNPDARIMVIGEAPGASDDIQGKPFVGESGQLLDKILAAINLNRHDENPKNAAYITNILNWRPPGDRTPTDAEIDISLPFIKRHIALIKPEFLILCGGISAKSLLERNESISKLRGKFQDYDITPDTQNSEKQTIPAIATYHPTYLLRTPAQKRAVWHDMLMLQERLAQK